MGPRENGDERAKNETPEEHAPNEEQQAPDEEKQCDVSQDNEKVPASETLSRDTQPNDENTSTEQELPEITVEEKASISDTSTEEETEKKPTAKPEDTVEGCGYPEIPEPEDPARILQAENLRKQRICFWVTIACLNLGMAMTALFAHKGIIIFIFILFIKAKDFLSCVIAAIGLSTRYIYHLFRPLSPTPSQWILTLIPAFSESEEQIVKTIYSLRDNDVGQHRQVMVVLLDGRPRDIRSHMTRIIREFERPYVTLRFKRGVLKITAGFAQDVPVICIEKQKNSGKKDSLVLCHDLFNVPRDNVPLYTRLLREEIWNDLLPVLTAGQNFTKFDMVFCTDADSTIYKGAVASLADALVRDKNAIAACGLVLVELEPGFEWSFWNLYQQFQYTYGQYGHRLIQFHLKIYSLLLLVSVINSFWPHLVRRQAESFMGKVTCLPGCITMIAVRDEMAGAIKKYSEPVTKYPVVFHQVQYLGTDRRLTYSMLSQDKKLHTLFVREAISETIAPQSLQHYLSQRRRWGSNAYFNNYFYTWGEKMIIVSRISALIDITRLSMVYYRVLNTALFIRGLIDGVSIISLMPLMIVAYLPTAWYMFTVFALEKELRKRAHKLLIGLCINKMISYFITVMVFTKVAKNLGSQVWGMSGVTATSAAAPAEAPAAAETTTSDLQLAEEGRQKQKDEDANNPHEFNVF